MQSWQKALVLLSLLLLFAITTASARSEVKPFSQLHQRSWNTEHGLPQVSVVAITQDLQGYMWLATEGGLARFDGNRFEVFNASHSPLFRNPLLRTLHTTAAGELLIGSSDKLIRYHQQQFTELTLNGKSVGSVEAMTETTSGRVFIAAEQLLVFEHGQLNLVTELSRPVTSLLFADEQLLIGGPGYLAMWTEQGMQTLYEHPQPGWLITKMTMDEEGVLLATPHGLWRFASGEVSLSSHRVQDEVLLLFQQQQQLWIATYQELLQYHGSELVSRTDLRQLNSIGWLVSAYQSRDGYLWFGSKTHGLLRFRSDATVNYEVDPGSSDPYVWALWPTDRELLVGHNNGLVGFDGKQFHSKIAPQRLSHPVVYSLYRQDDGTLWAGTRRGLNRISADYTQVQRYPALDHVQINGIVQRDDGSIWIATFEGLYRLVPGSDQPELMTEKLGLPTGRFRVILRDSKNRLWLGTPRGAFIWDGAALTAIDDPLLSDIYISYITELRDGRIVLGTLQHGFAVEQPGGGWQKVLPKQGLPAADVIYLAETEKGLLVSNFNGVYRLMSDVTAIEEGAPVEASIIIDDIGPEAGMDGLRCCNGAGNSKGALWRRAVYLPSLNGLVAIELDDLTAPIAIPEVLIEQLQGAQRYYPSEERINLSADERDLEISFTAPAYYRPRTLIFSYRLLGFEQEWTEVSDRRQAFYTNLPPGEFIFEVQARFRGEGEWSKVVSQAFSIQAFWYEQFWFYALLLLLLLSMFFILHRYRLSHVAKQQYKLEQMVTERTQDLNNANQQLELLNQRLHLLSVTDSLTGLHNRHYLQQTIDAILARAHRQQKPLLCVLLDLDNFKKVNDSLGHQVGDDVLRQMAGLLKRLLRQSDHLIRWGGEEFLIIQEQQDDPDAFLNRLQEAMAEEPWTTVVGLPFKLSCSIGAVQYPLPDNINWSWNQALVLADKALYEVKNQGKAGWLMLQPKAKALHASDWLPLSVLQMVQSGAFSIRASTGVKERLAVLTSK